jgi:hypothetical protein
MDRRLSARRRISPSARLVAVAATGVAVLVVAAVALAPGPDRTRTAQHPSRIAGTGTRTKPSARRSAGAVSRRQLARARAVAGRFLAGYLRFAYGQAPASSVRAAAPALRRQLTGQRALPTPVERRRRPLVIALVATGGGRGVAHATALVDDGGIANYTVGITLRDTRSGWLVTAVDGG